MGGGVSRRGLIGGFLRKPAEVIREKIPEALRSAPPKPAAAAAKRTYPRRLRNAEDVVKAVPDANAPPGAESRFVADLRAKPLLPGGTYRVEAAELAEPLVLVRVTPSHVACTTGACPLDGSDLKWHAGLEALWCPGCGSQWRLDGNVTRGPNRTPLLSLHVAEDDGIVRIDVP